MRGPVPRHTKDFVSRLVNGVCAGLPGDPYWRFIRRAAVAEELVYYVGHMAGRELMRPTFQRVRVPVPTRTRSVYLTEYANFGRGDEDRNRRPARGWRSDWSRVARV